MENGVIKETIKHFFSLNYSRKQIKYEFKKRINYANKKIMIAIHSLLLLRPCLRQARKKGIMHWWL